MKKIIILILSTNNEIYEPFIVALKETWVKKAKANNIECFFYEGGYHNSYIDGDTIKLNVNDDLNSTSEKLISAIDILKKNKIEFDFIFRTNLSSFIIVDNFLAYFKENEKNIVYCGYKGKHVVVPQFLNIFAFLYRQYHLRLKLNPTKNQTIILDSDNKTKLSLRNLNTFRPFCKLYTNYIKRIFNIIEFASGSGLWLNKDAVEILLSERDKNFKLIDDVMVGKVMNDNKILVCNCDRIIFQDDELITNDIDIERLKANYHIRLKSIKNRDIDVLRMYKLNMIEISDNIESDLLDILNM